MTKTVKTRRCRVCTQEYDASSSNATRNHYREAGHTSTTKACTKQRKPNPTYDRWKPSPVKKNKFETVRPGYINPRSDKFVRLGPDEYIGTAPYVRVVQ